MPTPTRHPVIRFEVLTVEQDRARSRRASRRRRAVLAVVAAVALCLPSPVRLAIDHYARQGADIVADETPTDGPTLPPQGGTLRVARP